VAQVLDAASAASERTLKQVETYSRYDAALTANSGDGQRRRDLWWKCTAWPPCCSTLMT
jgi:hypothetical protein